METKFKGTTIVAIKKDGKLAMAGDGQVSMGNTIVKKGAKKVRKLANGKVLAGFAGSTADALTLLEKFESKLQEHQGNLIYAAVGLAKEWRMDKILRRLEALLVVGDTKDLLLISGSGDVIIPDDNVVAIGSGGPYALAAARAFLTATNWDAEKIATESLKIAAEICIYTNNNIAVEVIEE